MRLFRRDKTPAGRNGIVGLAIPIAVSSADLLAVLASLALLR
jgi:hypothetical protein